LKYNEPHLNKADVLIRCLHKGDEVNHSKVFSIRSPGDIQCELNGEYQ